MDKTKFESFCRIFKCRKESITKLSKKIKKLPVKEIWPRKQPGWHNHVLEGYLEVLKRGPEADYKDLPIWGYFLQEMGFNHKTVARQFERLWEVHASIKEKGFRLIPADMVEVVDVRYMKHNQYDNRMTEKWYRLSGEHRLAVCYHMEILIIPVKIFKVRIEAW